MDFCFRRELALRDKDRDRDALRLGLSRIRLRATAQLLLLGLDSNCDSDSVRAGTCTTCCAEVSSTFELEIGVTLLLGLGAEWQRGSWGQREWHFHCSLISISPVVWSTKKIRSRSVHLLLRISVNSFSSLVNQLMSLMMLRRSKNFRTNRLTEYFRRQNISVTMAGYGSGCNSSCSSTASSNAVAEKQSSWRW